MSQQLDLIDRPSIERARKNGLDAAQAAVDRAQRVVDPEWGAKAMEAIRRFARGQGDGLFTMEMCRGVIELDKQLAEPTDKRAWGAITVQAVRAGYLEQTKTFHPAASSNGAWKRCYRRGPKA
jgi:hypothetical protein